MNRFLLFLIITIQCNGLFAEGLVTITESNKKQIFDLHGNLFYLVDTNNNLSFKEINNPKYTNQFIQAEKSNFHFKANSPDIWFKLKINNTTEDVQTLILSINNPLIEHITYFSSTDSVYMYTGALHVFDQRQVPHKNFLFTLKLAPNEIADCIIKIESQASPIYVPISLNPQEVFIKKQYQRFYFIGLSYTLIFFFLLLTALLYKTEKNKTYLVLFLFLILFSIQNTWHEGFFFQFFWTQSPIFNLSFGRLINFLTIPTLALFAHSYLEISKKHKRTRQLYIAILGGSLLYMPVLLWFYSYKIHIAFEIIFMGMLTFYVYHAIYLSRKKQLLFFNEFIITISLLLIILLLKTSFEINTHSIGLTDKLYATLIMLLFFILETRLFIKIFQGSRNEVMELNKNLEHLVDKRTAQLSSQKEELKSQQEELILQKETLQNQREELRAQKELLEVKNIELEKLSLVASKTDNLIYIFDPNGELSWFNKSFSNILGLSMDDYERSEPVSILDVSNNKNIRHVLNTCLREKSTVTYESKYKDKSNVTHWYHTTLTPILDDRENIKHLIAIDTDITKLKQFEEELNQQKQDAENQKNLAVRRKEELEARQNEITDSIRYAKRIQTAIMPKLKQIVRDFQDSFVLFLPKDIVSGDFYWYHRVEDKYFIAAVDCTGHGVPGAFMSIIGNYLLNSIIIHNNVSDPSEILKQLNRKIKIALKSDSRTQTSDGMDISIAVINKNNKTIEIASALRPLYLFNDGNFIEIKGDKVPITSNISGTTINTFKKHVHPFNEGDKFYMFSDGIIDQFGGKHGKKFLTKRFKQLLFEINPLTMREQKEIIKKAFDEWKGDNEQVDDVLVMGIKFTENLRK